MSRVTVEIARDGVDVARWEGVAAIAVTLQKDLVPNADPSNPVDLASKVPDMPVVSLRADNAAQLSVMLGCLLGVVEQQAGPEAVLAAIMFSRMANFADPEMLRTLPRGAE